MDIFLKNLLTEFTKKKKHFKKDNFRRPYDIYIFKKKLRHPKNRHHILNTAITNKLQNIFKIDKFILVYSIKGKISDIHGNPKNKLEKSSTYEFKCDAVYIGQTGQDGNFLVRFGEHFQSEIIINIDNKLDSYEGMYIMQRKKKNAELMNGDIGNVRSNPFDVLF
jgi:hypothetical protein